MPAGSATPRLIHGLGSLAEQRTKIVARRDAGKNLIRAPDGAGRKKLVIAGLIKPPAKDGNVRPAQSRKRPAQRGQSIVSGMAAFGHATTPIMYKTIRMVAKRSAASFRKTPAAPARPLNCRMIMKRSIKSSAA